MLQGKGERRETGRNSKILIVEEERKLRKIDYDLPHRPRAEAPLAVIHSYAEGRKERIAEEKRDKYVDTKTGVEFSFWLQ